MLVPPSLAASENFVFHLKEHRCLQSIILVAGLILCGLGITLIYLYAAPSSSNQLGNTLVIAGIPLVTTSIIMLAFLQIHGFSKSNGSA